ncbi:hypothetical protein D049_0924 [Vibrio parahaemolyticus VPTS-2010]|nr:hypothetical protein D039_2796 [Vibrio parahaemolyticus EKP-028]EXJ47376.1 hypothetical protein D049_0924 [Vibrio parahaemolyticus VPTS-2010]
MFQIAHKKPRSEREYQVVNSLEHEGQPQPWNHAFKIHRVMKAASELEKPNAILTRPVAINPNPMK